MRSYFSSRCHNGHVYPPTVAIDRRNRRVCPACAADREVCHQCKLRPVSRKGHPFCSKACSNASRARLLAERFLDYYRPLAANACWPWTGTTDRDGYGVIGDERRRQIRAHRIAYERAYGPVPPDQYVLHRCDNPPCCNPAHLKLGTLTDNSNDKVSRHRHRFGEAAPNSKLLHRDVVAIRQHLTDGEAIPLIAKRYGVKPATIWMIHRRKTWKHVR